jgi:predicted AAA+ superfamily ATPase
MEDKGLFNRTITSLAETLYNETTLKTNQHLVTKALSLGIPVSENYTKERNIFVITQSIMTLVD